jgi:sec-independent protein translocase protein TatC
VLSSFFLFTAGAVVAYFTLSQAVNFLVRVGGPEIDIRSGPVEFVRLSLFMMLAFGTGFLFPVVLVALQMIGIVTPKQLSSWRRQTVLIIVILAAAITPSGDPVSLAALAIPMYLFYEVAVLIGRLLLRKKVKAEDSESTEPDEAAI